MPKATQTSRSPSIESAVSSSMQTLEKAMRPTALDAQTRTIFGLTRGAQSITFNNFSPDPWTITGVHTGARLVTISRMSLTVVRPDPPQKIFYILSIHVKSEGWTGTPPNTPPTVTPLRVDLLNAQGGIAWFVEPRISVQCGTDDNQRGSETIAVDIFNLISRASISMPSVTFWRC